ncbi:MAG TPA: valine--tRNA ligase, partial [Nocardioidaceae bacterium]|nr:valine--tRNA ligase [Nocardioidaceae bacterium]
EVWSWWRDGSIHRAPWPTIADLGSAASSTPAMLAAVADVLTGIRGAKSQAKVKMRTPLSAVTVTGPADAIALAEQVSEDLRAAGNITGELVFTPGEGEITVEAQIAEQPEA